MTEYVHYKTTIKTVAKGILLKEDDHVESTGAKGMLVECVGAAPFEEQPYVDQEKWDPTGQTSSISAERGYEIHDRYLSNLDYGRLHIVNPDDVTKRYTGDNQ